MTSKTENRIFDIVAVILVLMFLYMLSRCAETPIEPTEPFIVWADVQVENGRDIAYIEWTNDTVMDRSYDILYKGLGDWQLVAHAEDRETIQMRLKEDGRTERIQIYRPQDDTYSNVILFP